MSFKHRIKYKGITINDAYFTIHSIDTSKDRAIIKLNCYANQDLYQEDKVNNSTNNVLYVDTTLSFKPDIKEVTENIIKQGYACKELKEKFPEKIDILEG